MTRRPVRYLVVSLVVPARDQSDGSAMIEVVDLLQGIQLGAEALGYDISREGCGVQGRERIAPDGQPPKLTWE